MSIPSVVTFSAVTPVWGRANATTSASSARARSPKSTCRRRPPRRWSARVIAAREENRNDPI